MNIHQQSLMHPALSRLQDRTLLRTLGHVAGRWTAASDAADFAVTDPATGLLVARVAALGVTQTEAAIAAAEAAFALGVTACPRTAPVSCGAGAS